ncbi:MAG: sigma-70 family RNA polymerase sigma factor [Prevotella sp.]|nr:sigma-70 family RNA polymerase sigma factor [Prevotella sp.]
MRQERAAAIEWLFRMHYARMYRTAFSLLRDEEESKDVVSGVFAKICDGGVVLREDDEEGFLVVCVRNACLNVISKKKLHEKLLRLYPLDNKASLTLPTADEERLNRMLEFIDNEMTVQTSRIFKLCFDEGKTYKEAAEMQGVSVAAVNKHIVKALKTLREKFGKVQGK